MYLNDNILQVNMLQPLSDEYLRRPWNLIASFCNSCACFLTTFTILYILAQAFVSFVGECPDIPMLEDVLSAFHEVLHYGTPTHQPLVSCLKQHGGERLFMSLLQREQQSLRLLGLQILTSFQGHEAPSQSHGGSSKAGRICFIPSCERCDLLHPPNSLRNQPPVS